MKALKMTVMIGRDRRVVIDVPEGIQEGPAEVILLAPEGAGLNAAGELKGHIRHLLAHSRSRTRKEIDLEIEQQRQSWD